MQLNLNNEIITNSKSYLRLDQEENVDLIRLMEVERVIEISSV